MRPRDLGAIAAILVAVAASCGGGQSRIETLFDTGWQNDGGKSIGAVQANLANRSIPKGASVAVGVVDRGLVGVTLQGAKTWSFGHALNARPCIAGSVVVGSGGNEVFALDAESGRRLWVVSATGKVLGAGDDGRVTLVSLSAAENSPARLLAVDRDGAVTHEIEANVPVGSPAVVSNLGFIPWQNQYVTVFDLERSEEVGRVVLRHQTSHAFVAGGSLYFGEVGVTRFDQRIADAGRDQASKVTLPLRELPGKPKWLHAGGIAGKTTSDAFDAIRAYARPEPSNDGLGLDSDRYYATYYRIVVGLQGATGELSWVQRMQDEALGGAAFDGGLALCQRSGSVLFFDGTSGALTGKVSLGRAVRACVVQADDMVAESKAASAPLVEQIADAVDVTETEMVMMHGFLVRELIAQESPKATQMLIALASDSRTPNELKGMVREGIASRRNGAEYMLEALGQRYDFLSGVMVTPPVGPLADALSAMKENRAASLLAEHLNDPANSTDDVRRAALALEHLATEAQLEALKTFFALYRATAHDEDIIQAVVSVAKAILRVGGKDGREIIRAGAHDSMTVPSLQQPLRDL